MAFLVSSVLACVLDYSPLPERWQVFRYRFFDESSTAHMLEYCADGISLWRRWCFFSSSAFPDRNCGRKLHPHCQRKVGFFGKSRPNPDADPDCEVSQTLSCSARILRHHLQKNTSNRDV